MGNIPILPASDVPGPTKKSFLQSIKEIEELQLPNEQKIIFFDRLDQITNPYFMEKLEHKKEAIIT